MQKSPRPHFDPSIPPPRLQPRQAPYMANIDASIWNQYKNAVLYHSLNFLDSVSHYSYGRTFFNTCPLLYNEIDKMCQKHLQNFVSEVLSHQNANLNPLKTYNRPREDLPPNQNMAQNYDFNSERQNMTQQQQSGSDLQQNQAKIRNSPSFSNLKIRNAFKVSNNAYENLDNIIGNIQSTNERKNEPSTSAAAVDETSFIDLTSLGRKKNETEIDHRPYNRRNAPRGYCEDSGWENDSNNSEKRHKNNENTDWLSPIPAVFLKPPSYVTLSSPSDEYRYCNNTSSTKKRTSQQQNVKIENEESLLVEIEIKKESKSQSKKQKKSLTRSKSLSMTRTIFTRSQSSKIM
jgi:hypothetical protein